MIVEHYTVTLHSTPAYRRRMMAKRRALRRRRITAVIMAVTAAAMMTAAGVMIANSFRANPVYAMTQDEAPIIEPFPESRFTPAEELIPVDIITEMPATEPVTNPAQADAIPEAETIAEPEKLAETATEPDTAYEQVQETKPVQEYTSEGTEPATYCGMTDDQVYELALMCVAEAEGEPEYGQRLVIDTALNRMDDGSWPNEIIAVIHQAHQFTSFENGRAAHCTVTDYFIELVKEELGSRTNYDVFYFTAGQYGRYGTPLFQVGNHYFSGK